MITHVIVFQYSFILCYAIFHVYIKEGEIISILMH
jgi:hypothetical protein